jgi:FtsZ-binding cell division protein ZapB
MESNELDQFELLEQKVEAILSVVNSLREKNAVLERRVKEGENKLQSIEMEMNERIAEREAVKERVAALLKRIEEYA